MKIAHTLAALAAFAPVLAGCASTGVSGPSTATVQIRCNGPDFSAVRANGRPQLDEGGMAANYEMQLRATGVKGHQTRWWNGCLQTFVRIDGKEVMKFYDPNTLREVGS
jgi:hypothetical protein